MMKDVRLKLSPPWVTYINKLQALFDGDPEIAFNVDTNGASPFVTISTNNGDKATALTRLLPVVKNFGNVELLINIDGPRSNRAFPTNKELFDTAFEKNPAFACCVTPVADGYWYINFCYVIFKNCINYKKIINIKKIKYLNI